MIEPRKTEWSKSGFLLSQSTYCHPSRLVDSPRPIDTMGYWMVRRLVIQHLIPEHDRLEGVPIEIEWDQRTSITHLKEQCDNVRRFDPVLRRSQNHRSHSLIETWRMPDQRDLHQWWSHVDVLPCAEIENHSKCRTSATLFQSSSSDYQSASKSNSATIDSEREKDKEKLPLSQSSSLWRERRDGWREREKERKRTNITLSRCFHSIDITPREIPSSKWGSCTCTQTHAPDMMIVCREVPFEAHVIFLDEIELEGECQLQRK